MAYKFQRGEANLSGAIELSSAEAELSVSQQDGSKTVELTQAGVVSGSSQGHFNKLTIDSVDVISNAQQLQNIASLDATTEGTIEAAIDTLANLASAGTNGQELEFLGSIDAAQGIKVANANFVDSSRNVLAAAVQGTNISASAALLGLSLNIDGTTRITQAGAVAGTELSGTLEFSLDVAANSGLGMTPFDNSANVADLAISASFLQDGTVAVADDQFMFFDSDGSPKRETIADLMSEVAGAGLAASSGVLAVGVDDTGIEINSDALRLKDAGVVTDKIADNAVTAAKIASAVAGDGLSGGGGSALAVDLNELSTSAIDVSNAFLPFVSGSGANESEKVSVADFVAGIAGAGLAASGGQLSTQAGTVRLVDDSTTLVEGYNYYTGSANKAVTLPASPSVGDVVYVKAQDLGDGNAITISRAGSHTIDGETSIALESDYAAVGFVYLVANNWGII